MCDNDHTDAELARRELAYEMGGGDDTDQRWDEFTSIVEDMLVEAGVTDRQVGLDGDQETDGFSIDFAYDAFERGEFAGDYARSVISFRTEMCDTFSGSVTQHENSGDWG